MNRCILGIVKATIWKFVTGNGN